MYDQHIDILKEGESSELINFNNEEVLFADVNLSSRIAKVVKTQDKSVEIKMVNSENIQEINTYEIDGIPKGMYTKGNMIAVDLGSSVVFIDDSGWLVKKYEAKRVQINNIVMSTSVAGIVSRDKIYIISF